MANPWEEINLSDYENHMGFNSVKQLQALNDMMKNQLDTYPVSTAIIFGIAGGNGLEHIDKRKYSKVYGIDINADYVNTVKHRYASLSDCLKCMRLNLITETKQLPKAELVIANLLIEYIGYDIFQKAILYVKPKYVSCIIQCNTDEKAWVSDSPYLHMFDRLDAIHQQIEEHELKKTMMKIGYRQIKKIEQLLPYGKKLIQIDFGQ